MTRSPADLNIYVTIEVPMEYAAYKIIAGRDIKKELLAIEKYFEVFLKGQKLGRIYWGSESCVRLLPSTTQLQQLLSIFKRKKLSLTLVSPAMLNDQGIIRLRGIFDHLNSATQRTEVVVNDWGALELLQEYSNLTPLFGRLLNKGEKDPRPRYKELGKARLKILRSPITANQEMIKYLISQKVAGIEFDNLGQGFEFGGKTPKINLHIYYPLVATSLTRVCLFASTFLPEKKKFRAKGCKNECLDYILERDKIETKASQGYKAYQISQGIYYENYKVPDDLGRFKRIVITII